MAKIIYNDKVYTSRFNGIDKKVLPRRQISIARGTPPDFSGDKYPSLMPEWDLITLFKDERINVDEFKEIYYNSVLSKLEPEKVYEDLKGKVICCHESRGEFCHRKLVIEWLKDSLGEDIVGGEV